MNWQHPCSLKILDLLFTFVSLAAGYKPNIIDILCDDLSYTDAGFHIAGIMFWPEKIKVAHTVSHMWGESREFFIALVPTFWHGDPMHSEFFAPKTSLKICGVTSLGDARALADLQVDALGINFWPPSKRYCSPEVARTFAPEVKGKILRVGVFVNNARPLAEELFYEGLIDVVQLHGDESREDIDYFLDQNIPVIRAVSAKNLPNDPPSDKDFALLIDTPAGKDYGGTGKTFDWSIAPEFIANHPELPILLAGGLNPTNAAEALATVQPAALDIASGAEISPGVKDFDKINSLMSILP